MKTETNHYSMRAQLADQAMCHWADQVMQSQELPTMRGHPEELKSFLTGLLVDLRILCDESDVPWWSAQADAEKEYWEVAAG